MHKLKKHKHQLGAWVKGNETELDPNSWARLTFPHKADAGVDSSRKAFSYTALGGPNFLGPKSKDPPTCAMFFFFFLIIILFFIVFSAAAV